MKVSDVMSRHVEYVSTDVKIEDIARLIFGRGINGLPVCEGKKVIGFITERDILSKFYPSAQEYIEDPFGEGNFEMMEEKVPEILALTAEKIMSKNPTTVTEETPLLRAQSLMFVNKVGRLPVVDKNDNLVGMISKGDIFRAVVGGNLQFVEDEEYHDWLSRHYDMVVSWGKRLQHEIPNLVSLFRENKVKKVLDVGCGTGGHTVALAKEGFEVLGLERSSLMFEASKAKRSALDNSIKKRITFLKGEYIDILRKRKREFGAAIFMGNALPHNAQNYKNVIKAASDSLLAKNSVLVLQIVNAEKIFKKNKRLEDFNIAQVKGDPGKEYAFLEFYDPPKKTGDHITLNMGIFHFDGRRWHPKSINSTPIAYVNQEKIKRLLRSIGFSDISFYGGMLLGSLMKQPFDPLESDYLNVVAKR